MVQQIIETGTTPNDGLGDSVRSAGTKINSNFSEVYTGVNNLQANVTTLQANVTALQANVTTLSTLPGTVNTISGRVTVIEDSYVSNADLQSALGALVDNDSQTLSFNNSTFVLGISNVSNTVNLSPMVSGLANVTYVDSVTSNLANTQYVDNAVAGAQGSFLEDETSPTLTATLNANAQSIENINDVSGTGSLLLNTGTGKVLWWEDTYGSLTINSSNTSSHLILANQSAGASANIGFVTTGNLYMSTAPGTNGNIVLNPSSATGNVGKVILQGATARGSGEIVFNCEFNSHGITLKGPPHSANADYVMTLPTGTGNNTEVLHTDGQGNTYWAAASGGGGGGGATDMASLTDVDSVDTVATGDMLLYDGSKYGFVNFQQEAEAYVAAGLSNISVANLSNVDSNDTPVTGDMLLHDGSEFKYVNYEDEINARITGSSINALSDVDTTTVAPQSDYGLVWDADNSRWEPQAIYIDTLNTVVSRGSTANSDITVNGTVTVDSLDTTGVGTPVIESGSEIILRPTTRVNIEDGPIRPANLTETQRDGISALTGDIITNANTNTLQVYDGSNWNNLGSSGVTYGNSDVDVHLNTSTATSGQILSWTGTDYDWVDDQTGGGGSGISNISEDTNPQLGGTLDADGNNIDMGTNVLTDTNLGQFITAYGWGDHSVAGYLTSVPAQSFASLTGKPTTLAGYGITDGYTDSDVDTHLNQSTAGTNEVLSWDGSDYAWVAQSGGGASTGDISFSASELSTDATTMTFKTDANNDDSGFEGYYFYGGPTSNGNVRIWVNGTGETAIKMATSSTYSAILQKSNEFKFIGNEHQGNHPVKFYNNGNGNAAHIDLGLSHVDARVRITDINASLYYSLPASTPASGDVLTATDASGTTAWQAPASPSHTFNVVNNGASDYTFSDTANHWFPTSANDPVLYLRRGETYNFAVNASGHPFQIRVSNGGSAYSTGVTNNGTAVGTVTFKVPMSAPSTLYYQCTAHSGMGNTINIV